MKVEIVYKPKGWKKGDYKTSEFSSMEEGFKFILYNSPMEVIAIRVDTKA